MVSRGDQDLKDHQALLVKRELPVRKGLRGQPAGMESRGQLACQVQQDQRVYQVKMETRVNLESRDKKAARLTRVNRVHQVHQVLKAPLDNPDQLALMVNLVPEGSKVSLARKVMKAQGVSWDLLVQLVCRGYLALRVRRARQGTSGLWVHLDHQDPEVPLAPQGQMVHKVLRVGSGILELWARRVTLANLVPLDLWDTLANRDQGVSVGRKVNRGRPVLLVPRDRKVHLETMGRRAAPDQLVSLVTPALLVKLDLRDKMDLLETREKMAKLDRPVPLVRRARLDHLVLQARGVPMVLQVLKEDKERKEPRETLVLKVLLARQAQWGPRDHRGKPAPRVCAEFLVPSASKVSPAPQAQQVHLVRWVLPDCQDSRAIPEQKERRVTLA